MSLKLYYLIAFAAVAGCATVATPKPGTARSGNSLSAEEINDAHADITTAYDAVMRLRPNWLAPHASMSSTASATSYASVFVDGQAVGDVSALRNIAAYEVGDLRYYNVAEAGARFGIRAGTSGAIEVFMKSPSRP